MRAPDTSAEPWWEGQRQLLDAPRVPQLRSPLDFRLVVDQSLSLVVITDTQGRIEYVNPRFTQVTGYHWFEAVGKLIADFGGPPPEENVRMWEALTSGRSWRGEFEIPAKDGDCCWLSASVSPVKAPDGTITHYIGVNLDITESRRAEAALRESEEKFRRLGESVPAGTFIFQGSCFRFANTAMEKTLGYTADEMTRMNFWDAVHPEFQQIVKERGLARQSGEDVPSHYEIKFVRKDGEVRWGLVTATPIEYEGGPAVIGSIMDITERKVAEEAVRASEEKFRMLADTVPAAITIVQGTSFRFVNSAVELISGYTRDELANMDFWETIHPDHQQLIMERGLARQEGKEPPSQYEAKLLSKSGEERWGLVTTGVIEYEGEPATIGTMIDITERKAAEAALRASEEKFRMLSDTVPAATFIAQGTKLRFANSMAVAILGYSREELLKMNFYDFLHPDMKGLAKDRGLARQRGEDVPSQYEIKFVTKAGEERWGIITAARLEYEGKPAIIGSVIDITERKVGEDALHASEERYRMLYQDNPSMYFTLCQGLTVLAVNKYGAEQLGYEPEDLIGEPVLGVVHPGDRNSVRRQLTSLLQDGGARHDLEFRKVRKNGEMLWVKETVRRTVDADGKTILLVVCEDITERRRIEETSQRLREDLERKAERVLAKRNPYDLSFRELTVLHLVVNGRSDKEIAVTLGIRPLTVSKHVANVLKKMRAASRTEAGVRAWREGLIE